MMTNKPKPTWQPGGRMLMTLTKASQPSYSFLFLPHLHKHTHTHKKIAADVELNKMNLDTLFGPNFLHPAPTGQEESLLNMAAVWVNVLMYFVNCLEEYLDEVQVHTSYHCPPCVVSD